MNHISNLTDFYESLAETEKEWKLLLNTQRFQRAQKRGTVSMLDEIAFATRSTVIEQAITDIRKYQDRMSIDGRAIQHIADSLEKLVK